MKLIMEKLNPGYKFIILQIYHGMVYICNAITGLQLPLCLLVQVEIQF